VGDTVGDTVGETVRETQWVLEIHGQGEEAAVRDQVTGVLGRR
jgi:hypothetical protein